MTGNGQAGWITYAPEDGLEAWWVPAAGADEGARRGTVLMLQEIFGVNAAMRDKAQRFAQAGYDVLLPDLYARSQRRLDLGYAESDRALGFQLMQQLDVGQAVADCARAADWARRQSTSNGKMSAVGFCLGGMLAVRFAAAHPCDAVASFYGVRVDEQLDALQAIAAPVQYHVGDQDAHIPAERVETLRQAAQGLPQLQVFVYPGAKHGFFNRARSDVYDEGAARTAAQRVFALLGETLK